MVAGFKNPSNIVELWGIGAGVVVALVGEGDGVAVVGLEFQPDGEVPRKAEHAFGGVGSLVLEILSFEFVCQFHPMHLPLPLTFGDGDKFKLRVLGRRCHVYQFEGVSSGDVDYFIDEIGVYVDRDEHNLDGLGAAADDVEFVVCGVDDGSFFCDEGGGCGGDVVIGCEIGDGEGALHCVEVEELQSEGSEFKAGGFGEGDLHSEGVACVEVAELVDVVGVEAVEVGLDVVGVGDEGGG